ncbi:LAQU0S02e06304g1_1 [Lachancea quebecensis]|uniref:LAQU0S02e06304g1_1 n=1 Tax=Lachancea quebecensis TaxID=1654605 RepID=A0A0P1KN03_9SACH|nr:LAQU0S02e06304g1_1 [Lachancea quebecensis]
MSFLRKLFGRKDQGQGATGVHPVSWRDTDDLDSEYVFVTGGEALDSQAALETRSEFSEDPSEVDVTAWEMARAWTRRESAGDSRSVRGSKAVRLAHRLDDIRNLPVVSSGTSVSLPLGQRGKRASQSAWVVEYHDESMDEEAECLFDDKWNRKSKVESRRDRFQKCGA